MAEMEELLQVSQIDAKLPGFLNLASYALSAEDIYLRNGLYHVLKDHIYIGLRGYQKDDREKRFMELVDNISFDLFSESENSLATSFADVFHKFKKGYSEQNKHLSELQNNYIFLDLYSTFSDIKTAYNEFSECLSNEKDVSEIRFNIGKISAASTAYNDAVKKMANIFVECGIVSLEDVSDPISDDTPEYFQALNQYLEDLNGFLAGSEGLNDEKLKNNLREIDTGFDSKVFDNVLEYMRCMYTGHKILDWSGIYNHDYRLGKSSDDSLFGLIYHLIYPSKYSILFWEDIFEGLGFEIQKSEGHLIASIGFKDFMNLDLLAAEKT